MKVRIKALPKALSGLEVRMNPGLGQNHKAMPWPGKSGKMSEPEVKLNSTLGPIPREDANLEAEKGEFVITPGAGGIPETYMVGGNRHSKGGTPLKLSKASFIYSDTKDMKIKDPEILKQFGMPVIKGGYTPADIAKKYDVNKFLKFLKDPNADDLQRKTAEGMIANYNLKLAKLALIQESIKGFPTGIPEVAMPYMEAMQLDPSQFVPQQQPSQNGIEQVQGAQPNMMEPGQQESMDPNMGMSQFGGQMFMNQLSMRQSGGQGVVDEYIPWSDPGFNWNTVRDVFEWPQRSATQLVESAGNLIAGDRHWGNYEMPSTAVKRSYPGMPDWLGTGIDMVADPLVVFGVAKSAARLGASEMARATIPVIEKQVAKKKGRDMAIQQVAKTMGLDMDKISANKYTMIDNLIKKGQKMKDAGKSTKRIVNAIEYKAGNELIKKHLKDVKDVATSGKIKELPQFLRDKASQASEWVGEEIVDPMIAQLGPKIKPIVQGVADNVLNPNFWEGAAPTLTKFATENAKRKGMPTINNNNAAEFYRTNALELDSLEKTNPIGYARLMQDVKNKQVVFDMTKEFGGPIPYYAYGGSLPEMKGGGNKITKLTDSKYFKKPQVDVTSPLSYKERLANAQKELAIQKLRGIEHAKVAARREQEQQQILADAEEQQNQTSSQSTGHSHSGVKNYKAHPAANEWLRENTIEGASAPWEKEITSQSEGEKGYYGNKDLTDEQWAESNPRFLAAWENGDFVEPGQEKETFNPRNPEHLKKYEEFHNSDLEDGVYYHQLAILKSKGKSEKEADEEARKMAKQVVNTYGFTEDPNDIRNKDQKWGEYHRSRKELGFNDISNLFKKKEEEKVVDNTLVDAGKKIQPRMGNQGDAPWWLQDIIKTAGAAGDFMRVKKYNPWQATPGVQLPETTFYDPTRELAASAEQTAIGSNQMANMMDPQAYAANFMGLQGQGFKNAADIMAKYNNLNVGASNQQNAAQTALMNQAAQTDAGLATQLYDKYTAANQQFDNAKNQARQNLRQSYIQAITNKANTQAMNALYEDYNIDPSRGGYITENPWHRDVNAETPTSPDATYNKAKSYMDKNLGMKWDEAIKLAGDASVTPPKNSFDKQQYMQMLQQQQNQMT